MFNKRYIATVAILAIAAVGSTNTRAARPGQARAGYAIVKYLDGSEAMDVYAEGIGAGLGGYAGAWAGAKIGAEIGIYGGGPLGGIVGGALGAL